jgi:hypothetical protein
MSDLIIDMCLASHNLQRQTTLLLDDLGNLGSPGHSCRVTLQHTEAYRVTRALVPGHPAARRGVPGHPGTRAGSPAQFALAALAPVRPVPVTGQTGDHHLTPFW